MLTAIALVALVGVAMAAAASVFGLDLRRTAAVVGDAQLRQLLVAGERAARQNLPMDAAAAVGGFDGAVPLPPALAERGATLALRVAPADPSAAAAEATVEAALAGRVARQTLRYERGPAGWRLAAAELHAVPGRAPSPRH
jgi:hypothetical protein